jgi:hypothetical protein
MQRNAKKEFVFSDGTVIPVGAKLVAPTLILHRDPTTYEDPETFQGFRFVKKSDDVLESTKTIVNGGTNFHLFGAGRHPWSVISMLLIDPLLTELESGPLFCCSRDENHVCVAYNEIRFQARAKH